MAPLFFSSWSLFFLLPATVPPPSPDPLPSPPDPGRLRRTLAPPSTAPAPHPPPLSIPCCGISEIAAPPQTLAAPPALPHLLRRRTSRAAPRSDSSPPRSAPEQGNPGARSTPTRGDGQPAGTTKAGGGWRLSATSSSWRCGNGGTEELLHKWTGSSDPPRAAAGHRVPNPLLLATSTTSCCRRGEVFWLRSTGAKLNQAASCSLAAFGSSRAASHLALPRTSQHAVKIHLDSPRSIDA